MSVHLLPDDLLRLIFDLLLESIWNENGNVAETVDSFVAVNRAFCRVGRVGGLRYGAIAKERTKLIWLDSSTAGLSLAELRERLRLHRLDEVTLRLPQDLVVPYTPAESRALPCAVLVKHPTTLSTEIGCALCPHRIRARIDITSDTRAYELAVVLFPALEELDWRAFNGEVAITTPGDGIPLRLKRLALSGVEVTTGLFELLSQHCHNLETLTLFNVRRYGMPVAPMTKLVELAVNLYDSTMVASVAALFKHGLPMLKSLRMSDGDLGMTQWCGLHRVFLGAPQLEALSIIDVRNVTANMRPLERPITLKQLILTFLRSLEIPILLRDIETVNYLDVTSNYGSVDPRHLVRVGKQRVCWDTHAVTSLDFCSAAPENISMLVNLDEAAFAVDEYRHLKPLQDLTLWVQGDGTAPPKPKRDTLAVQVCVSAMRADRAGQSEDLWEVKTY